MKIQKHDATAEKSVLTGMIVDDRVVGRILSKWNGNLFRNKWSNLIGGWCIKHYQSYEKAPGQRITHYFERWAEKSGDSATVQLVEKFLTGLSEEWETLKRESNTDYLLDLAGRHFALVQMERLQEEMRDAVADQDPDKAEQLLSGHHRIKLGLGEGIDVLHDKEAIRSAFGQHSEPLIEFSGALGKFFGDAFCRCGFVSLEGPEGRGKSYWLQEVAVRAVLQRRRTVMFELGDMTRDQLMERIGVRIAANPLAPGRVKIPRKLLVKDAGSPDQPYREASVEWEERSYPKALNWGMVWQAAQQTCQREIRSQESYWKLFSYAPDVLHCRDIEATLSELARDNWIPDVIVIDYADLLNMTYSGKEGRDCINETWKHLRKISVLHHCLVVTATQTNAQSAEAYVLRRRHFSEDKRKRSHITAGFGLNQTEAEKDKQVMRLNNIKRRKGAYSESRCVFVVGCLDLAHPAVRSAF